MTPVRPVIMCGGSGTRLWPLSRRTRPKHLLPLIGGNSLLQDTALRLTPGIEGLDIVAPLVVTGASQAEAVADQLQAAGINPAGILIEPVGRNTAAVAAAAAAWSEQTGDTALLLLLPSDHHIARPDRFAEAVAAGVPLANDGAIVTFGIIPDRPHTGYGYIRRGGPRGAGFAVDAFKEKPDASTAAAYIADTTYSWNAGIFLFAPATMTSELNAFAPDIANGAARAVAGACRDGLNWKLDADKFSILPSKPIDIAVMEKTGCAAVIPVDMGWSDVGTWSSLFEILEKDADGNTVTGNAQLVDCRSTQVRSTGPYTAVIGVEGVSVIVTDDGVLVVSNNRAEDVKNITDTLTATGANDLL